MIRSIFWIFIVLLLTSSNSVAQSKYAQKVDKYLSTGDTAKALKKLNKFIAKKPEATDLYLKRAKLKMERGDYDPAMVDLNSFCSLNRICGEAEYLKGLVRFKQHDYNGAIAHLSEYTKMKDHAPAWFYLALSHMWLQNYPLAINGFQKSIDIDGNQPLAYYNAGLASFYSDNFANAALLFAKALELTPNDSDIKIARANALMQLKKFAESNTLLREVGMEDKNYRIALFNIGVNYFSLNEKDLACDYWVQAKELGHLQAEDATERHCEKRLGRVKKW